MFICKTICTTNTVLHSPHLHYFLWVETPPSECIRFSWLFAGSNFPDGQGLSFKLLAIQLECEYKSTP